ncbi:unnamed protein product [Rhizophagus irregularis]|uniref:Uncharacterized protein n=1 Tax=Rhizophagus irregularis TaxID=588596 RepID=A0A915ZU54_9GLOM|nr:unnamed protein product [Rhizophagus irregularis]CAB5387222.1 unnamed protein product [Rhizophagus irregularis]
MKQLQQLLLMRKVLTAVILLVTAIVVTFPVNNDYFPAAHTTNSLNYNNYNQSIPQSTSKNNDIISPGHNYQQPTFNDFSNNIFNISPNNEYHQQSMSSGIPLAIH